MLEPRSALAGWLERQAAAPANTRVRLREITGLELIQLGFWADTQNLVAKRLEARIGTGIPEDRRAAAGTGNVCVMRIAPLKVWIIGQREGGLAGTIAAAVGTDAAAIADLSHARTILQIDGPAAADVVRRLVTTDIHETVFPPGSFAQTGLCGVGILLHAVQTDSNIVAYNFYLPRSFALALSEYVGRIAAPFSCWIAG